MSQLVQILFFDDWQAQDLDPLFAQAFVIGVARRAADGVEDPDAAR